MAHRASGRADRASGADPFPWVVSLGCLLVGIALFLHSTVPALEEQRELQRHEQEFGDQLSESRAELLRLRRSTASVGDDPEFLLVQMDALGLTPQQAIDQVARDLVDGEPVDGELIDGEPGQHDQSAAVAGTAAADRTAGRTR